MMNAKLRGRIATAPSTAHPMKKHLDDLIRTHNIAIENLTKDQLAEALRQAIACGDFTRLVVAGSNAQSVMYLPYAREQELESKIAALEHAIEDLKGKTTHLSDCSEDLPLGSFTILNTFEVQKWVSSNGGKNVPATPE